MTARSFVVVRTSPRAPAEVFALLQDGARWQDWAGPLVPTSRWEQSGPGVGAVRRLGLGPLSSREEVVLEEPPHRLSYRLLSGRRLHDYLGEVELQPDGDGTRIVWRGSLRPLVPGTAVLLGAGLHAAVRSLATHLSRA